MILYVAGDLFESPAQTLVNTVNTEGVMGKGIALTFKQLFPDMFREYQSICERGQLRIGALHIFRTPAKLIINFPTKTTWRHPSQPEFIEAGASFAANYQKIGVRSVAFPPLGCGNGELDFERQVKPLMERHLAPLPIQALVYPPRPQATAVEHRDIRTMQTWLRSEPTTLAFDEVWRDLQELLRRQTQYETIAQRGRFEAVIADDPARIRVRAAGKTVNFLQEEVREVWRELRHHLVFTPTSYPSRKHDIAYLLPILAELPYIDRIQLADSTDTLRLSPTHGIRLTPASQAPAQRDLLAV